MPRVKQVGLGKAAGSVTEYPLGTAKLAIEIQRLLAIKKKLSFVGWHLWMHGHEVDSKYWKPKIEGAATDLRRIPVWLRAKDIQNKRERETIFDQVSRLHFVGTLFAKGLAKLAPNMSASVFRFLADVAGGNCESVNLEIQSDDAQNRRALRQFIGQPDRSVVANVPIDEQFGLDLQGQFLAISRLLTEIQSRSIERTLGRSQAGRAQFLDFLNSGEEMILSPNPTGKSQIGRFAKALLSDPNVQAYALIIWSAGQNNSAILEVI